MILYYYTIGWGIERHLKYILKGIDTNSRRRGNDSCYKFEIYPKRNWYALIVVVGFLGFKDLKYILKGIDTRYLTTSFVNSFADLKYILKGIDTMIGITQSLTDLPEFEIYPKRNWYEIIGDGEIQKMHLIWNIS